MLRNVMNLHRNRNKSTGKHRVERSSPIFKSMGVVNMFRCFPKFNAVGCTQETCALFKPDDPSRFVFDPLRSTDDEVVISTSSVAHKTQDTTAIVPRLVRRISDR